MKPSKNKNGLNIPQKTQKAGGTGLCYEKRQRLVIDMRWPESNSPEKA